MREKVVRVYSRRAWLNDYVGVGELTLILFQKNMIKSINILPESRS